MAEPGSTAPTPLAWPGSSPSACLVSGASGGLGRAVAERLARAGATVVITSRDPGRAAATAAELAGAAEVRALPVGLDVADAGSVDAAARAVADLTGRLDMLVNNAAAYPDWRETATGGAPGPAAPAPPPPSARPSAPASSSWSRPQVPRSFTAPLPLNTRLSDQCRKHRCYQDSPRGQGFESPQLTGK
jgi:NAD(P)-dependent dehydrogenase (short-subunit alcohol dehydrogenase family)